MRKNTQTTKSTIVYKNYTKIYVEICNFFLNETFLFIWAFLRALGAGMNKNPRSQKDHGFLTPSYDIMVQNQLTAAASAFTSADSTFRSLIPTGAYVILSIQISLPTGLSFTVISNFLYCCSFSMWIFSFSHCIACAVDYGDVHSLIYVICSAYFLWIGSSDEAGKHERTRKATY